MKQSLAKLKVGILSLVAVGAAHAAPITMTATQNYTADRSWQDIKSTSYTWADANSNNQIDVGESVTFSVKMHKSNWGMHDFDALKVWIDNAPIGGSTLYSNSFIWDFDVSNVNMTSNSYSYKAWNGGDKSFSFNYTFATAGDFDLLASVMCSADLSGLSGPADGKPTSADWNAWATDVHGPGGSDVFQGETEIYRIKVYGAVPEPSTLALFGLSLVGIAGMRLAKRKKA